MACIAEIGVGRRFYVVVGQGPTIAVTKLTQINLKGQHGLIISVQITALEILLLKSKNIMLIIQRQSYSHSYPNSYQSAN